MLSRPSRIHHDLTMQVVGYAYVNDINILILQHLAVITVGFGDAAFLCKLVRVVWAGDRDNFCAMHPAFERGIMKVANKASAHHADFHRSAHEILLLFYADHIHRLLPEKFRLLT